MLLITSLSLPLFSCQPFLQASDGGALERWLDRFRLAKQQQIPFGDDN
jgi:hypothetical protein